MDINSVVMENKGAAVPEAPTPVGQERGLAEQVKPVAPVAETANDAMEENSLQAREQGREVVKREEASRYAKEIQERLDRMGSNLHFSVDEKTESFVYKFTSKEDGEVIRQIPSEDILALRSKFDELLGLIFDELV